MTLQGKCALITGSVQGLGLAAAQQFAQAGCNIVLNGFAEPNAIAQLSAQIEEQYGVRTLYCGADLRSPGDIEHMIQSSRRTFGDVDILINNAVVRHSAPVEEFSVEQWDQAVAVNLSAAFHTIRLVVPGMKRNNWGRIINVSSIYGLRGAPNRIGYVATKTALIGLTRAVALETIGHDITCNAVCPGTAETPVHEAAIQEMMTSERVSRPEAARRFMAGKQPTGRLIAAEHVAALMVFLCGPDSGDITGAALPVDGGWAVS